MNQTIELNIESLAYGGEGIARHEGKVYFVWGALPGETVCVRVIQNKKNFSRAETVEILKKSPDRVDPPCRYFGRCGGCQLQHLKYEEQLVWKRKWLEELLTRVGGFKEINVESVVPSPKPYEYRNRVSLTLLNKLGGRTRQGFLGRDVVHAENTDSRYLVDIKSCDISMPTINHAIGELAEKNSKGRFFGDFQGKLKLEIATDGKNTFFLPWQTFEEKAGAPGEKPEEGKILIEKISGLEFEFSPHVFFQVNSYLLPQLVTAVGGLMGEVSKEETCLFDLYSGVGFFGISLADRVKKAVALEENKLAYQFALRNIKRNKLENVFSYSGRAEAKFAKFFERHKLTNNIILVDPPRGGMEPSLIQTLTAIKDDIHSVIYLSCEPSILARDLARLKEAGFLPEKILPFDLFPQTQIFETVAELKPSK